MAKIDEIKEDIGWLKVIFGILTAVDVSLLGWLAQNYKVTEPFLLFFTTIIIVCCTVGIVLVNKKAYRKIKELGDL
jgi:Mn2+/Fe2+ NRAMP family transporter